MIFFDTWICKFLSLFSSPSFDWSLTYFVKSSVHVGRWFVLFRHKRGWPLPFIRSVWQSGRHFHPQRSQVILRRNRFHVILVAVVVTKVLKFSVFLIEAFKLVPRILHYIQGQCSIGMNIECYYSVHPLNCESNISLISLFSFSFHWCNWFRCLQEGFFASCFYMQDWRISWFRLCSVQVCRWGSEGHRAPWWSVPTQLVINNCRCMIQGLAWWVQWSMDATIWLSRRYTFSEGGLMMPSTCLWKCNKWLGL